MTQKFLEVMDDWSGFSTIRNPESNDPALARTLDLITNREAIPAHRHKFLMQEAITTSDFPYLFGQVIDRQMLAMYQGKYADWKSYIKVGSVPDFNTVRREKLHGIDNELAIVAEKGEYLASTPTNCRYTYNVNKYGRQFDISWEAIVNDSLGAFNDIPRRFAQAALRTENRFVTGMYAAATGDGNASLYGADITDCGQDVTNLGVLPLTIANLETTMELMQAQTDPNGEPISVRAKHLVVGPALEFTARAILTSALKQWTEVGAGGGIPVPSTNVIPQMGLQLHIDPYIPIIDTTHGTTSWYLFADPMDGAAVEVGYLRGYEAPEVVMKSSDKVSVGGSGLASPFSGDFATDNIMYRVRHIIGGSPMDPRMTYLQSGA